MTTIRTTDMTTLAASLTRVPSINVFNVDAFPHRLISQKLFKLKKAPLINFFSLLLPQLVASASNTCQLLKHKGSTRLNAFYNLLRNAMVLIRSETVLLASNLGKVSFGRTSSNRLKFRPESFIPFTDTFDSPSTKEPIIRSNSNLLDTSVNANKLTRRQNVWYSCLKDDIQEHHSVSDNKFSRFSVPRNVLFKIFWNRNVNFLSSFDCSKRQEVLVKPDIECLGVVSNRTLFRLRTGSFLSFFQSEFNRFKRLCCFNSCGDSKICCQVFSGGLVCFIERRQKTPTLVVGDECRPPQDY